MRSSRIEEAVKLAKEFIWLADALWVQEKKGTFDGEYYYMGSKYSAAVRRKSMDLTRALANMRKW